MSLFSMLRKQPIIIAIGLFVVLISTSSYLSIISNVQSEWFESLIKPRLYPGESIFFPVWTLLFALIAAAYTFVNARSKRHEDGKIAKSLFIVNLILNLAWTPAFFGLQKPELAYTIIIFIWGTLALLMIKIERFSKLAVFLLIPYLTWVTFATWLNYAFIALN